MIVYKKGNLIELASHGKYDVVLHGANCFAKMDDGIAREIATAFPEALKTDQKTIIGDKRKLGSYTKSKIQREGKSFYVVNCYTQFAYAGFDIEQTIFIDYNAYEMVMKKISHDFYHNKIAMPLIGTGHAGGDIDKILNITEKIFKHNNVDIIVYSEYQRPKQLDSFKNRCLGLTRFFI